MARRKQVRIAPDVDDNGPPETPGVQADVRDMMLFLRWSRQMGFRVEEIALGKMQIRVNDLRQAKRENLFGDVMPDRGPLADVGVFPDEEPEEGTVG